MIAQYLGINDLFNVVSTLQDSKSNRYVIRTNIIGGMQNEMTRF